MQYLITGGALAGSVLVLVACCSAITYAIKRRKQKGLSPTDISIQAKYLDTSRQISLMQNQQHNTLSASTHNDVLMQQQRQSYNNLSAHQRQSPNDIMRQSGCDTQNSQVFCETSFSSPSLGVSEDPLPSSRYYFCAVHVMCKARALAGVSKIRVIFRQSSVKIINTE